LNEHLAISAVIVQVGIDYKLGQWPALLLMEE